MTKSDNKTQTITLEGTKHPFNKAEKGEDKYFVKMPSDLMHYVHIPGYKPEYNYLYTILVDFYNVDFGYAFPTEWKIGRVYGKQDPKTVRNHLRVLERVGLISIHKPRGNKIYVPYEPLSREELFKVCPEAQKSYEEHIRKEQAELERHELEELPAFLRDKYKEKVLIKQT